MNHKTNISLSIIALLICTSLQAMEQEGSSVSPYSSPSLDDLTKRQSKLQSEIYRKRKEWKEEPCCCCINRDQAIRAVSVPGAAACAGLSVSAFCGDLKIFADAAAALSCETGTLLASAIITGASSLYIVLSAHNQEEAIIKDDKIELLEVSKQIARERSAQKARWGEFKKKVMKGE